MLARRLIVNQVTDMNKVEEVVKFLTSQSGSHDYTISRGGNGIRISGKGSWSLRMSCNRLIYGKIFGSVGILQKNTCVSAWVMAIYAWLDYLWCKRDGFPNREPEVDHLLWHAADPPSDYGPPEDGENVSGTEPP